MSAPGIIFIIIAKVFVHPGFQIIWFEECRLVTTWLGKESTRKVFRAKHVQSFERDYYYYYSIHGIEEWKLVE